MPVTKRMDPSGATAGGAATLRGCSGPVLQHTHKEMRKRESFSVIFLQTETQGEDKQQALRSHHPMSPSPHALHADPLEVTHPSAACTSSQPEQNRMDSMILRALFQLKCVSGSKKSFSPLPVPCLDEDPACNHSRALQAPPGAA